MKKFGMDQVLKGVGIIVAAGGLFSAIFSKDENKELKSQIKDLQKRIDDIEKK